MTGVTTTVTDALSRAVIEVPADVPEFDRCVVTVGSPGYEHWVEGLFGSVLAHAGTNPPALALFALADDRAGHDALRELGARYNAIVYACTPLRRPNPTSKAIMYTAAQVIPARRFVCLDADVIVLADLEPLFVTIDACAPGSILVCREANDHRYADLKHILDTTYQGGSPEFFDPEGPLATYRLVVNDGVFAGSRDALLTLDRTVRDFPHAAAWVDRDPAIDWCNQFVFNTALAARDCGVELDPTWNVQLHAQDVEVVGVSVGEVPSARWAGRAARGVHFCAPAKHKHPELRGWYRDRPAPGDAG